MAVVLMGGWGYGQIQLHMYVLYVSDVGANGGKLANSCQLSEK